MDIDKELSEELEKDNRLKEKFAQLENDIDMAIALANGLKKKTGKEIDSAMFPFILYFLVNKIEAFRNEVNFETLSSIPFIAALPNDGKISPDNIRDILRNHFYLLPDTPIDFFTEAISPISESDTVAIFRGAQIDMEDMQKKLQKSRRKWRGRVR